MDPTSSATPILRIQSATAYAAGGQQRSPFAQGQMLRGLISAQQGPQQFTIDINGQQVAAESTSPLQVGQKLELQVMAVTPRVELQIVSHDPVNQRISSAIHLMGQQAAVFSELSSLAEASRQLPQLSVPSQETLQFFAASIASNRPADTAGPLPLIARILERTFTAAFALQSPGQNDVFDELSGLLQQFSRSPSLSPNMAGTAAELATLFTQAAAGQGGPSSASSLNLTTQSLAFFSEEEKTSLSTQMTTLFRDHPHMQQLFTQLLPLLAENAALPSADPLRQLLAFLARLTPEQISGASVQPNGSQLAEVINRLGLAMEQQLAENQAGEANRTLKYALLELSQQTALTDKSAPQAEQLAKTIELFQLLQIRLNNEALFFQPLPLAFLDQGYLLVERDRSSGSGKDDQNGEGAASVQNYTLHLQLEGLGNLRITLKEKENRVALQFQTEDVERAKFLSNFREELEQKLTAVTLESIHFLVGSKEPVASLLEKIVQGTTGMVDTKA